MTAASHLDHLAEPFDVGDEVIYSTVGGEAVKGVVIRKAGTRTYLIRTTSRTSKTYPYGFILTSNDDWMSKR